MSVTVQVDPTQAIARIQSVPGNVRVEVRKVVQSSAYDLVRRIQDKLSGEVLNVRSGNLRRSIHETGLTDSGDVISDGAASDASVDYARIHEYGGRINVPEIVPKSAKALAFNYGGKMVFAMHAAAHVVNMPARPYMRPSLAEMAPSFIDALRAIKP